MGKERSGAAGEKKMDLNTNTRAVPDGGWGWIISIAAFVVQFIILGLQNHLGLFHREHLGYFKESTFTTGWVSSLALGNMFLFAPLTSALCEIYGCRKIGFCGGLLTIAGMLASSFAPNIWTLYVTFGIVYGIGTSMCYFPTLRTLPYWFSRNLALANGIAAAGSGVGTVAVGPLVQLLMKHTGWRNTARIISGLLLIPTLAALAYCVPENRNRKEKEAAESGPKPKTKIVDFSVLRNKAFIVLCLAMSTFMLGYFVPFIHVPRYVKNWNIDDEKSSNLVGIMSIGSTFGRLFFGKLSDHPRVNRLYLYQLSFFCIGCIQTVVPQITSFAGFAMYMVAFGVFDGCFIVLLAIVVSDVVGIDRVSTGMGVKFFFMALTTFVGPPFAGWLVDISGSYYLAFYTAGGSAILAFILLFFVPCLMPRDVRSRNRLTFDSAVEAKAEDAFNEEQYPSSSCPEKTEGDIVDSGDKSLSKSSLLSKPSLSCDVAIEETDFIPSDEEDRTKSNCNLLVIERMTTV